MSVDYYICSRCRDTFPDCGPFVRCENCGRVWCSDQYSDCAELDGYIRSEEDDEYGCPKEDSCSYCRNEKATNKDLFEYVLNKYGLERDKVEQDYLRIKE